MVTVRNLMV